MTVPRDAGGWNTFWADDAAPTPSARADSWYDVVWQYSLQRWHARFAEAPGRRMLECGCGAGRVSEYMAARGFDCTLVDYSDRALDVAKRRFDAKGLPARFMRADLRHLGFERASFDIVYSGGVLEFFDDVETPIAEMAQVLGPGGLFAAGLVPVKFSAQTLADLERTAVYSLRHLARGRWREAMRRVRMASTADGIHPWRLADIERACVAAGLEHVEGRVVNPFPQLALPGFLHRPYARFMRARTEAWQRFDDSDAAWTRAWGISFTVCARKGTGSAE